MLSRIIKELEHHAPFTALGALSGIIIMIVLRNLPPETAHKLFYVFHPGHVVLSALVTASMYSSYKKFDPERKRYKLLSILVIGYAGSIGVATLSDSVIPYLGEALLRMPHKETHIGFIEKWWLVNPLAIAGIAIAYFRPSTKFPHAGHVFISTLASLMHIMMAKGQAQAGGFLYLAIFLFLFLAVWVPCCVSDIIFPLLFTRKRKI